MKSCLNAGGPREDASAESNTAYQYWRHKVSGATYALRFAGGRVTGFYGPVAGDEIHPDDLPLYPYDAAAEELHWIRDHPEEFLRND